MNASKKSIAMAFGHDSHGPRCGVALVLSLLFWLIIEVIYIEFDARVSVEVTATRQGARQLSVVCRGGRDETRTASVVCLPRFAIMLSWNFFNILSLRSSKAFDLIWFENIRHWENDRNENGYTQWDENVYFKSSNFSSLCCWIRWKVPAFHRTTTTERQDYHGVFLSPSGSRQ